MDQLRSLLKRVEASEVGEMEGAGSGGMGGNAKLDFGKILEKLQDLKLDELLEDPPPGTDEAIAVAKVVQFAEKPEYVVCPHPLSLSLCVCVCVSMSDVRRPC